MEKNEARKHHYIPQFILKNFNNEKAQVNYWNIVSCSLELRNTKSIFMNIDMYRDEVNNIDNPTKIENKFAIFEREISLLISEKILTKNEITLTRKEVEKLRIFLSLLAFRSKLKNASI